MAPLGPTFRFDVQAGGVATVFMDVPGEPVNTLRPDFEEELSSVLSRLDGDPQVKAIVFASGKPDGFIVGADVSMFARIRTQAEATALSRGGQQAMERLEELSRRKPVVAAIHGPALGGGLEVALACSSRIATDDRRTQLGQPEVQLGVIPGAGGTQRLPRLIGIAQALDLILTGKSVRAAKARKLGLVDEVVPKAILLDVARKRALDLASGRPPPKRSPLSGGLPRFLRDVARPEVLQEVALEDNPIGRRFLFREARKSLLKKTRGHYPAPEKALEAVRIGIEEGAEAGYRAEAERFGELVVGDVARHLVEIFFATQELKKDTGVDDPSVKPARVEKVGMLGAGLMGAGIAYVTAEAGIPVRLKDRDDASLGRGLRQIGGILEERVERKRLTSREREEKLALVSGTTGADYSGFKTCDVVIEAVFEDLGVKQTALKEIEREAPSAIFASNTSSIPIGSIAGAAQRPEKVIGMHFFSPVDKMPLLEVIRAKATDAQTVATVVGLGKRIGKTVIVVNDGPGFYTSRILGPYLNEASYLLLEGAAVDEIDSALVDFGFPVGPLQLLDEVGIDVGSKVAHIMQGAFGDRMKPPEGFERIAASGRLGRKSKKGFYKYEDAKKGSKEVDESVYELLPGGDRRGTIPREEIAERCVLSMVNEAAYCLGEGILRSARDGDVGAIFGLGWPPFRGGPFRYADSLGTSHLVERLAAYQARFGTRFQPAPLLAEMARTGRKFHPSAPR